MPDESEVAPESTAPEEKVKLPPLSAPPPSLLKDIEESERWDALSKKGKQKYWAKRRKDEIEKYEKSLRDYMLLSSYKEADPDETVRLELLLALRDINDALDTARTLMKKETSDIRKMGRVETVSSLVKQKLSVLETISHYQDLLTERKKRAEKTGEDKPKPRTMPMTAPNGSPPRGGLAGTFSGRKSEE
jgi:hypothetical protein